MAAPSRNTAPRSSSAGFKRAFGLRTTVLVLGARLFTTLQTDLRPLTSDL